MHFRHDGMLGIGCTKHLLRDLLAIPDVFFLYHHHAQNAEVWVAQGNLHAYFHFVFFIHRQDDGDREEHPVCKAHGVHHRLMICFSHEPIEGRESTHRQ